MKNKIHAQKLEYCTIGDLIELENGDKLLVIEDCQDSKALLNLENYQVHSFNLHSDEIIKSVTSKRMWDIKNENKFKAHFSTKEHIVNFYVDNIKVGEQKSSYYFFNLNLPQQLEHDDGRIYQIAYYFRGASDFFAIYRLEDYEFGKVNYYIIDSNCISPECSEYHARIISKSVDIDKHIMFLIASNYD